MLRPTPLIATPFGPPPIATTADFITPNSMPIPAGVIMPDTQMIPPPILPTVNTMHTANYQLFPPIVPAATTTTIVQQQPPVTILTPPPSSRGLLTTGIRPITPPIGVRSITPPLPPPSLMAGSRVVSQSRIVTTGCCPQCTMCASGIGMGMCGPACGFGNPCMGMCGGGYGCCGGGLGCGCPFDETCRACCGCRCYI